MKKLWYNGCILSMDKEMRSYEAIGTDNGRIIYLGSEEEARCQDWDEEENLLKHTLLPGFSDTHAHMLYYALFQENVALFGVESIDSMIKLCKTRIRETNPGYLLGMGWNQETLSERRIPTRKDMDLISEEIPICLLRNCAHVAVCNSVMLECIKKLPAVEPSVMKLVDFSEGILREEAMRLYIDVFPKSDGDYVRKLVLNAQKDLNAKGITCVHSDDLQVVAGMNEIEVAEAFEKMAASGELSVRVYEQSLVDSEKLDEIFKLRKKQMEGEQASEGWFFRIGPRKLLQDGSLGVETAEMINPYSDNENNYGIGIYSQEELTFKIREAHQKRMDVAVHAIGDRAFEKVCNAVEAIQREDFWAEHRHAIVHAQITNNQLLKRMKALNIQGLIQPIFIEADMEVIERCVGTERARECYNWKTMLDMGIHISGGSDCPVEPFDIMDNIRAAVSRKNRLMTKAYLPEQALSIEEGLRLFTSNAAWACREEASWGTLEIGKLADMVILDNNPLTTEAEGLTGIKILETVIAGRTVYKLES